MITFGERLKKARLEKGLSKKDLGDKISVHYAQIGRYENKGMMPSGDVLAKIANVLEVSSDYLINGTTDEQASNTLKDKELLNQFKQIESMDDNDRNVIKTLLDAFITKRKIQQLAIS